MADLLKQLDVLSLPIQVILYTFQSRCFQKICGHWQAQLIQPLQLKMYLTALKRGVLSLLDK